MEVDDQDVRVRLPDGREEPLADESRRLLRGITEVTELSVISETEIEIDSLPALETVANALDVETGQPLAVYQVLVAGEGSAASSSPRSLLRSGSTDVMSPSQDSLSWRRPSRSEPGWP